MRIALDTNLLVYAEAATDDPRSSTVTALLAELPADQLVLPLQVLGELHRVLTQKAKWPRPLAQTAINTWMQAYETAPTTPAVLQTALQIASDHQISTWDAIILAVAAEQRCRYLLSEDYHNGFQWQSTRVINPFVGGVPADLVAVAAILANPTIS